MNEKLLVKKSLTNNEKNCPLNNELTYLFFISNEFIDFLESIWIFWIFLRFCKFFFEYFKK